MTFAFMLAGVVLGGIAGYLDGYWNATVDLTMPKKPKEEP